MIAVSLNVNNILCYDRADALFYIEEVETRYKIGQADPDAVRREVIISDDPREGNGLIKQPSLL